MPIVNVPISVQGPLDTANPSTNRAPGSLVEATELSPLWLGPRFGFTQQTWPYQGPSGGYPACSVPIFDGTNGHGVVTMRASQQFNLPTAWTLDLVIRPSGVTHSADTDLLIFSWDLTPIEAISVYIKGGGAVSGTQRKIVVLITPTSSPGVAGTTVTLTGTTQVSVGTAIANTHHIRVVRNIKSATLYVNGTAEATTTSLTTQRHEAGTAKTVTCRVLLAGTNTGGNHLFAGRILSALLRVNTGSDVTKGLRDFQLPFSTATRFALDLEGIGGVMGATRQERSSYQGTVAWSGMTSAETVEPAPWALPCVQAGVSSKDVRGRVWNWVMAGGTLYWARAH